MKRVTRKRPLTREEAERYDKIRKAVEAELPEIVERMEARKATRSGISFSRSGYRQLCLELERLVIDLKLAAVSSTPRICVPDPLRQRLVNLTRDLTNIDPR